MRKKIAIGFLILVLCISLVGCGKSPDVHASDTPAPTPTVEPAITPTPVPFDLDEYKSLVAECNDLIMDASILLSNMGSYEYNYWKSLDSIGGQIDYDDMGSKAEAWLNENADVSDGTIQQNYDSICELYKQIIEMEIEGKEAEKISDAFDGLFAAYNSFHLLVTEPSGDRNSFSNHFNEYSEDIKGNNSLLLTLTE